MSSDEPEDIVRLITDYPEFKVIYDEVYNLCLNVEKVMEMFSKELKELDQNTVQLMIDEMQEELDAKDVEIENQKKELESKDNRIRELEEKLKVFYKVRSLFLLTPTHKSSPSPHIFPQRPGTGIRLRACPSRTRRQGD